MKIPLKGEVGGHALKSHGNYIDNHGKSRKNHGVVSLNFCGNPDLILSIKEIAKGLIRQCIYTVCFCLFDLILYVPSTIFQLYKEGFSWA